MLRITEYADRLEKDLELVDWPHSIKKLQSDWIGRSTGAEVDFYIGMAVRREVADSESRPRAMTFQRLEKPRAQIRFSAEAWRRRAADLHHAARHAVRRNLHGHCAGASVCRSADRRPSSTMPCRSYCEAAARKSDLDRTELVERENRRVHRFVCHQPSERRSGADLGGRLCADQLRHRRDHGGAGA